MPNPPAVASTTTTLSSNVYSLLYARANSSGKKIYRLHLGDTFRTPPPGAHAEQQRTERYHQLHNYTETIGLRELREAVVRHHQRRGHRPVRLENVQITAGATNGLSVVVQSLVEPGEEVLILAPFWPLIRGMVAARGATAVQVPFFTELDQPGFDVAAQLDKYRTDKTVAVYVNTPNNPTGRVLHDAQLRALADYAIQHNLWVLSDEAYEEIYFGDERPRPLWDYEGVEELAIGSHTLSKSYAMTGARVAYLHGPSSAMKAISAVQVFQNYCAPHPMQRAAIAALEGGDAWLEESRKIYRDVGMQLARVLGVDEPQGGTFLFVDMEPFFRRGETMLTFLARCADEGILMTPGLASGDMYKNYARICYTSVPPHEIAEVAKIFPRILALK